MIAVEEGETTSWYRFLAALLNPARVLLQPLRLVDIPVQPKIGITKQEWEQLQQSDHTHMWSYVIESGSFSTEAIFEELDITQCRVVSLTQYFAAPGALCG